MEIPNESIEDDVEDNSPLVDKPIDTIAGKEIFFLS